ncbi:MAG: hypothetical protein JW829_14240 [Pirellulales bacterium]|nr:hypothetical protein [Pirellulales bacterium]
MTQRVDYGLAVFFLCILGPLAAAAEPLSRIELEIATIPSSDVMAQRRWYEYLKDEKLGGLRLRQAREGESPSITERHGQPGYYKVVGVLTHNDRLQLTGATFARQDMEAFRRYLTRLAEQGIDGATAPRGTFGLTEKQFNQIHSDLIRTIEFETKDRPLVDLIKQLRAMFRLPIDVDPRAEVALERRRSIDEMKGFSAGTGLAVLLRHEGLAFRPAIEQGRLKHHVFEIAANHKNAPDGMECWSPGHEPAGQLRGALPILFEQINVQIEGYTLTEALNALRERIDAPFLFDHSALAERNIHPDQIKVRFPAGRTYYKRVLDSILSQAKLKGEVRVDEAGKVFYWITARRKPE